jgi:hypothetical protein
MRWSISVIICVIGVLLVAPFSANSSSINNPYKLGLSQDIHTVASRRGIDSSHHDELIVAAHKILDMGMECGRNGTSRDLCHAALSTAIRKRGY